MFGLFNSKAKLDPELVRIATNAAMMLELSTLMARSCDIRSEMQSSQARGYVVGFFCGSLQALEGQNSRSAQDFEMYIEHCHCLFFDMLKIKGFRNFWAQSMMMQSDPIFKKWRQRGGSEVFNYLREKTDHPPDTFAGILLGVARDV